jgi:hypothetical protein
MGSLNIVHNPNILDNYFNILSRIKGLMFGIGVLNDTVALNICRMEEGLIT